MGVRFLIDKYPQPAFSKTNGVAKRDNRTSVISLNTPFASLLNGRQIEGHWDVLTACGRKRPLENHKAAKNRQEIVADRPLRDSITA